MDTGDHNTSLRVASFSSYLDAAQENLAQAEKTINPSPFSVMFSKPSHDSILANLRVDSFSSNRVEDPTSAFTFSREIPKDGGEIGVFNADKYFNMKLDYKNVEAPANLPSLKPKAPSLCSESTSWNSRTALIIPDNTETRKHKKAFRRKFIFAGFGCKGSCFDKKSVADLITSKKPTKRTTGSERTDPKLTVDESRPSIEVFGSSNRMRGGGDVVATNMERKLSMLTWDAIPKSGSTAASTTVVCDDMASEASSDLFEIDNILQGSINFPSSLVTDDVVSTCMSPNSHYAPSEASIQWSVVTASAAADCSVLSDFCNDSVSVVAGDSSTKTSRLSKARVFEGAPKGRAVGLLGCKSHRAVDVAEKKVVCQKSNFVDESGKSSRVKDNIDNALKLPRTLASGGGLSAVHYPSIL